VLKISCAGEGSKNRSREAYRNNPGSNDDHSDQLMEVVGFKYLDKKDLLMDQIWV
jgi:hypothetical protein